MKQPLAEAKGPSAPRFYVTPRQRLSLGPVALALVLALACLFAVLYALNHSGRARLSQDSSGGSHSGTSGTAASSSDDDDGDPSSVDTIYLADPSEAPTAARPAARPSSHPSAHPGAVHPFVIVHLPRSGPDLGQIPDTPAGHLLYTWLAAFNGKDRSATATALLTPEPEQTEAAQLELRTLTGGFTLLSSKEVQPGLLVFRLHDEAVPPSEVLGTLQMRPGSGPASIASFSLRSVPNPGPVPDTKSAP